MSAGTLPEELLKLLVNEVGLQCRYALRAKEAMDEHVSEAMGVKAGLDVDDMNEEVRRREVLAVDAAFFSAHAFLIHAANVSKLLWPPDEYASRGQRLREELGVGDSLLIKRRKFRNHLEHYDQRLHKWASQTGGHIIVDRNVLPKGSLPPAFERFTLRQLDPDTDEFIFRGESFELTTAARELADVLAAVEKWQRQHDPTRLFGR